MLGMRPKEKEEITVGTSKSKTFGSDSALRMDAGGGAEQSTGSTEKAAGQSARPVTESKPTTGGVGKLDAKARADRQKAQERRGRPRGKEKGGSIQ